jgi:hypothetical protein
MRRTTAIYAAPFLLVVLYVLLSGPIGGLICYFSKVEIFGRAVYSASLEAHGWHWAIYSPLLKLAGKMGLGETLLSYWAFFGWGITA